MAAVSQVCPQATTWMPEPSPDNAAAQRFGGLSTSSISSSRRGMTEQRLPKAVDIQCHRQRQPIQHVAVRSAHQRGAVGSLRAVRSGHVPAVERGNHLPLTVTVHPDRPFAQPGQRLGRHRPQRNITQQHDGLRIRNVGFRENCAEGRKVAVDVRKHRHRDGTPLCHALIFRADRRCRLVSALALGERDHHQPRRPGDLSAAGGGQFEQADADAAERVTGGLQRHRQRAGLGHPR